MTVQLKEKTHSKAPTAGPSADDRFGAGPIASNAEARIIMGNIVGGRTRITIARGEVHGVRAGLDGHVTSGGQTIATFQIDQVKPYVSYAFIDTAIDRLGANAMAVINPTTSHAPPTHEVRSRVIQVSTVGTAARITIARGFDHGIHAGMRGTLVSDAGVERYDLTIELVDGNRSYATVDTTADEVNKYQNVILRPLHAKHAAAIQRRASGTASTADVQATADAGVASASSRLPHFDTIQRAFGKHDISNIQSQVGGAATSAAASLGAQAYATGNRVAFASSPDLHTAAHEAAHTIQQRHGAVGFQGLGAADDEHEHHADAVADAVVTGQSAEPLLDKLVGGSPTTAIQRKHDARQTKPPGKVAAEPDPKPPTMASNTEAYDSLKEGEEALAHFHEAVRHAEGVYEIMIAQANLKAIHEQSKQAYERAKKTREKILAKTDLEKVLSTIGTLIELGTSVHGFIKAARTVYLSARGLKDTYTMYKATGLGELGGKLAGDIAGDGAEALGKGVKSGKDINKKLSELTARTPSIDPQTILADTNHEAITAGNAALSALTAKLTEHSLIGVDGKYREGAFHVAQMANGFSALTRDRKVLSDDNLARFQGLTNEAEKVSKAVQSQLSKLHTIWKAYLAGGAEALADGRERTLFELIESWIRTKDAKAQSLKVAMDQSVKHVVFSGSGQEMSRNVVIFFTHRYEEKPKQGDAGTLYVTDPDVAAGLGPLLREHQPAGGWAEMQQDHDTPAAQKFSISISMCKALESLGLHTWYADAAVHFYRDATYGGRLTSRHKGDWYEHWHETKEFEAFWQSALGRRWAYVQKGSGGKQLIPGATPAEIDRSSVLVHSPPPK